MLRLFALMIFVAGCASPPFEAADDAPLLSAAQTEREDLSFTELAPGVWLHTSYKDLPPSGAFPSNGLIVARGTDEAVLIDTAWNDEQTEAILAWVRGALRREVTAAVMTHAHDDKMGGVGALRAAGVATYAHPLSNDLAPTRGLVPAETGLAFDADGDAAEPAALDGTAVFYPGPGHTDDNVVARIEGTHILFGGCLIRPAASRSIGNTEHADVRNWDDATEAVAVRFPDASVVVPSHGAPGGRVLLDHTVRLAGEAAPKG